MCSLLEVPLSQIVKFGAFSAIAAYKIYDSVSENKISKLKTKTHSNQLLFIEGISLSNRGELDYVTCRKIMLKMEEEVSYDNMG